VNIWRDELETIVEKRIQDFKFSSGQEDTLRQEINDILTTLIDDAKLMVENADGIKETLRKFTINFFFDWDKLYASVPELSESIMQEIQDPGTRENLKEIAISKLDEYAASTIDSTITNNRNQKIYKKYGQTDREKFNTEVLHKSADLKEQIYNLVYVVLFILILFGCRWIYLFKKDNSYNPLFFILSVSDAFVVLICSLLIPMLEIDARITTLDFKLFGESIVFTDQILFYRSKSILDIVFLLLQSHKIDSIIVGILILCFSVLFPITKLISTIIYIYGNSSLKEKKIINFFAFKSGKWSMADVMVVAIFMSFIGFKNILDDQLKYLNIHSDPLQSLATNYTSLQPGFILFLAFVLFGLGLSVILKRMK
ncbi:MAG TPA: paraquat-inducible protein A, partial [Chitinophagales bacterium]|nr:paraquat-inducible protein A [Chitinophagales bacterium]